MSSIGSAAVFRHRVYYLSEGTTFLVESCLFKVPRYMLELQSEVFQNMFALPPAPGSTEGETDANPIHLEGTESVDFERLLMLLYPLTLNNGEVISNWGEEHWISILKLSDKWAMAGARSMALEKLGGVASGISKLTLGRKYDYSRWVWEGLLDLCTRSEMLTVEEARQLDLKDVLKCAKAREAIIRSVSLSPTVDFRNLKDNSGARQIIKSTFGINESGKIRRILIS